MGIRACQLMVSETVWTPKLERKRYRNELCSRLCECYAEDQTPLIS